MAAQRITMLDGGLGHLLKERKVETSAAGTDWSSSFLVPALANVEAPGAVQQVHQDYISAGADVITVNNFPVTPWSLGRVGRQDAFVALTQAAANLARTAADQANHGGGRGRQKVQVAGSLPPLGESYSTQGGQRAAELAQPLYTEIAAILAPAVDILLCETMASSHEAWAAASAAAATGLPTWVALTLEDSEAGLLRSGEPVADVAARLAALPGVEAVLLNCSAPQAISAALLRLRAALPNAMRIGAYGNGFRRTTSEWLAEGRRAHLPELPRDPGDYQGETITPEAYARFAKSWADAGATIIGGCCGVGPEHIAAVRAALAPAGSSPQRPQGGS
jgi:homocysteine S-methyltransferase